MEDVRIRIAKIKKLVQKDDLAEALKLLESLSAYLSKKI